MPYLSDFTIHGLTIIQVAVTTVITLLAAGIAQNRWETR